PTNKDISTTSRSHKELDTTNAYRQKVMNNYTSVCIVNHNLEENNYSSVILFSIPKNRYHHIHLENNYTSVSLIYLDWRSFHGNMDTLFFIE
ncbi:hypothetical protein ACJX0J_011478, partial [Zea mays]